MKWGSPARWRRPVWRNCWAAARVRCASRQRSLWSITSADLRPVAGQVQVPCIERNAIAAVKAVNAARMALRRTSEPRVCLDKVIETMYETGKDMNAKYRETSRGGLAMKIVACD
ncbi:hypothetical protein CKF46_20975 [Klebsiella pneumoniae]|nr:hypothetical protein CKF46_20975 [Klebsiella pneumoniae]